VDISTRGRSSKLFGRTSEFSLKGHLAQIGTGEGKSIILGVLSTILALLGFCVSCACYSKYLSTRDYNSFKGLFSSFGVASHITYSTLSQLAGDFINSRGDIREYTRCFLERTTPTRGHKADSRKHILLLDEVDVFFSREFYGATYNPSTTLKNHQVTEILEYIWKNRNNSKMLPDVQNLPAYKDLIAKYSHVQQIIANAVTRMIAEVNKFNEPPYYCVKNAFGQLEIGYKEGGTVNTNVLHGYKTCFAYLNERDRKTIPHGVAQEHLGLTINCGQFSYSEVPHEYAAILGVTGTLATLGNFETTVKNREYNIEKSTFTPPIYGDSQLAFKEKDDVFLETDSVQHALKILNIADDRRKRGQAVLVFFESEDKIKEFTASSYSKLDAIIVSEDLENIDSYLKKAALSGQVTFLPRVFGRGLDFVGRDFEVDQAGGVHVIQTFLSENISEEIQIKGRTARQGRKGSFNIVLNMQDVIQHFSMNEADLLDQRKGSGLYEFLSTKRVQWFEMKSRDRSEIKNRSLQLHAEAISFRQELSSLLLDGDTSKMAAVTAYFTKQNPGIKSNSRIVCLSDATGSMDNVWNNAKSQVSLLFFICCFLFLVYRLHFSFFVFLFSFFVVFRFSFFVFRFSFLVFRFSFLSFSFLSFSFLSFSFLGFSFLGFSFLVFHFLYFCFHFSFCTFHSSISSISSISFIVYCFHP
jgi:SecA DEAD-like domain